MARFHHWILIYIFFFNRDNLLTIAKDYEQKRKHSTRKSNPLKSSALEPVIQWMDLANVIGRGGARPFSSVPHPITPAKEKPDTQARIKLICTLFTLPPDFSFFPPASRINSWGFPLRRRETWPCKASSRIVFHVQQVLDLWDDIILLSNKFKKMFNPIGEGGVPPPSHPFLSLDHSAPRNLLYLILSLRHRKEWVCALIYHL